MHRGTLWEISSLTECLEGFFVLMKKEIERKKKSITYKKVEGQVLGMSGAAARTGNFKNSQI